MFVEKLLKPNHSSWRPVYWIYNGTSPVSSILILNINWHILMLLVKTSKYFFCYLSFSEFTGLAMQAMFSHWSILTLPCTLCQKISQFFQMLNVSTWWVELTINQESLQHQSMLLAGLFFQYGLYTGLSSFSLYRASLLSCLFISLANSLRICLLLC